MNAVPFRLSTEATERLTEILADQSVAEHASFLRVAVLAGGCNGFQYKFDLTNDQEAEDAVIEAGPARVLVDPASLEMLEGAELHYTDSLMGSYFTVRNPHAKSSCGCGTSFSVD